MQTYQSQILLGQHRVFEALARLSFPKLDFDKVGLSLLKPVKRGTLLPCHSEYRYQCVVELIKISRRLLIKQRKVRTFQKDRRQL